MTAKEALDAGTTPNAANGSDASSRDADRVDQAGENRLPRIRFGARSELLPVNLMPDFAASGRLSNLADPKDLCDQASPCIKRA